MKELGYDAKQCVLYVKLSRSIVMLEIKSDHDTTLFAECLSHRDILECFVCHFLVDQVLIPLLLEFGESGVGDGASQNTGPNASFNAELEPTHQAQENVSIPALTPTPAAALAPAHVNLDTSFSCTLFHCSKYSSFCSSNSKPYPSFYQSNF